MTHRQFNQPFDFRFGQFETKRLSQDVDTFFDASGEPPKVYGQNTGSKGKLQVVWALRSLNRRKKRRVTKQELPCHSCSSLGSSWCLSFPHR